MKNKTIKVGIRTDMQNKAGEEDKQKTGLGWFNVEISIEDFIEHVKQGYPFAHQFTGGRRKKENFLCADVLIADIDHGMRLEEALEDKFIRAHATFIYTTPSHTPDKHRFRIVFCLDRTLFDADGYEAMYASLLKKIPTDPSTKSSAQFFFGSSESEIHLPGKSINDELINEMISEGMEERYRLSVPAIAQTLNPDMMVYVKNQGLRSLGSLGAKTSIQCPFGTHPDKHPSAFVKINKDGVRGVECRSCGQSAWSEPLQTRDQDFEYFDKVVKQYSEQANSHFEYLGLTRYNHDLETSLEKSNFHVFHAEKLEYLSLLPGVNLIKSPKGTGKTHALSKLVATLKDPKVRKQQSLAKDHRIILVGHRQALIRESAAKLGLSCYLDTASYDTHITNGEGGDLSRSSGTLKPSTYAVCLDSLHSRMRIGQEDYGVLIIDESEQVFSHFLSEHMQHPTSNFDILSTLMRRSKFIYCLDADLGTITLTGVMSCLGWRGNETSYNSKRAAVLEAERKNLKKLYCHLNTYKPVQKELLFYSSKNQLLLDLMKDIAAGKRCYVVSNNKTFIKGQYEAFSKVYSDKKFKLVVADEGDDKETRQFLKNVTSEILDYEALWASPSMGTGIDITFPGNEVKVDCVYGFFDQGVNSHLDIDQQLGRVRHPGVVKVWVSPVKARLSVDRRRVLQELLDSDMVKGLRYFLDHDGSHFTPGEHPFLDLLTEVLVVRRRSMNDLKRNFIEHKANSGWKVVHVLKDEVKRDKGSIINKAGRAERGRESLRRVLEAQDIDFKEFFRLKQLKDRNEPLTDAEKANLERYWIKKFYHADVTEDLVKFDEQGKTRERIGRLESLTDSKLPFRSYSQWENEKSSFGDYRVHVNSPRVQQAVFLREVFATIGIFDLDALCLKPKALYGTATLRKFVEFMQRNDERLQRLFEKTVNEDIEERPVVQVAQLLKLVGLQQEAVVRNRGGKIGVAKYKIEIISYHKLLDIITLRAQSKSKDEELPEEIPSEELEGN